MSSAMSHARYRWNTPMARRQEMRGISEEPSPACFASSSPSRGDLPRWPSAVMLAASARCESERKRASTLSFVRRAFGARHECGLRERGDDDESLDLVTPRRLLEASDARVSARPRVGTCARGTRRHSETQEVRHTPFLARVWAIPIFRTSSVSHQIIKRGTQTRGTCDTDRDLTGGLQPRAARARRKITTSTRRRASRSRTFPSMSPSRSSKSTCPTPRISRFFAR